MNFNVKKITKEVVILQTAWLKIQKRYINELGAES